MNPCKPPDTFSATSMAPDVKHQLLLLDSVAEHTETNLAYLDTEFRFLWVNKAYIDNSGRSREELLGHNHFDYFPNTENEAIFRKVRDSGVPYKASEEPFQDQRRPEQAETYWDWTLSPVMTEDGSVAGLVLSLTNRTQAVLARREMLRLKEEAERRAETLREHDKRLRVALDAAELGAWEFTFADDIVDFDTRAQQLYRLQSRFIKHEDMVAANMHPDDVADMRSRVNASLAPDSDGRYQTEYRILQPDGRYRWIRAWGQTEFEGAGETRRPVRMIGASRDVTEVKQAEDALKESERKLREELNTTAQLHQVSTQMILSNDAEALYEKILDAAVSVLRADFASMQVLHRENDDPGRLYLISHRGFNEHAAKAWEWVKEDSQSACGVALRNRERVVVSDIDDRNSVVGPEDRRIYTHTGIRAVQSTPLVSRSGVLLGMLSTHWRQPHEPSENELRAMDVLARQAADMIDHIRARDALVEAVREKSLILDNANSMIAFHDTDNNVLWASRTYLDAVGVHESQLKGRKCYSSWGLDKPCVDCPVTLAIQTGEPREGELTPENQPHWSPHQGSWIVKAAPVRDNAGTVVGAIEVALDITQRKLMERQLEELYEREHTIAHTLQSAIIPPGAPDSVGDYQIAVKYRAALKEAEIGGDFYDVFEIDNRRLGILIGDVVGKGLQAAIRVAAARHAIRAYAHVNPHPAEVMRMANDILCKESTDVSAMLTAFFAIIDLDAGTMSYTSAGHEPPIVVCPGGDCEELKIDGLPVGLVSAFSYNQAVRDMEPGDLVVIVTDGITEARAPGPELFGKERLIEFVRENRHLPPDKIASGILEEAVCHAGGQLQDDAAIVVLALQAGRDEGQ